MISSSFDASYHPTSEALHLLTSRLSLRLTFPARSFTARVIVHPAIARFAALNKHMSGILSTRACLDFDLKISRLLLAPQDIHYRDLSFPPGPDGNTISILSHLTSPLTSQSCCVLCILISPRILGTLPPGVTIIDLLLPLRFQGCTLPDFNMDYTPLLFP